MKFLNYRVLLAFAFLIFRPEPSMARALTNEGSYHQQPCPGIILISDVKIELNADESILICGDAGVLEWQKIPLRQARIHLQAALEGRGYHGSRMVMDGDHLRVEVGPLTKVKDIVVKGFALEDLLGPYQDFIGRTLTSGLLDEVQTEIKTQLWRRGYPCTSYNVMAYVDTGTVMVDVDKAYQKKILSVEEETPLPWTNPGIMSRYYAFHVGETFDSSTMELSTRRMVSDGIVQSARYSIDCREDGVIIKHHYTIGKSRLISAGVGASNEMLFIFRVNWKSVRLDSHGSSVKAGMYASFVEQRLEASANWYPTSKWPRIFLQPAVEIRREKEKYYEVLSEQFKMGTGALLDFKRTGLLLEAGPVLTRQMTLKGVGPRESNFLSLNAFLEYMSHDFEFYRAAPRSGFSLGLNTTMNHERFISPLTAYLFSLSGEYLHNVQNLEHPFLVLGVRGRMSTTYVPKLQYQKQDIPLLFRHFLGGNEDLRGFSRKQLPHDPQGALTSLYIGTEARISSFFNEKLWPLIFLDTGWLGQKFLALAPSLYWSPGLGLRFESPIGTFRGVVAHGYIYHGTASDKNYLVKMNYYLSYGQEF